jgi:hypothetical protein
LSYTYYGGPDFYLNRPEVFLAGFLCGPDGLAKLTAHAPVYRDDLPRLEYIIAKQSDTRPEAIIDLIAQNLDPARLILNGNPDGALLSRIQQIRTWNLNDLTAMSLVHLWTDRVERFDVAKLQAAADLNPNNITIRLLLANALRRQGQPEAAEKNEKESLRIDPEWRISKELGRVF